MRAYKVFTHDLCSPIRGGDPIWDGSLPYDLPPVEVDRSSMECAAGWNAARKPSTALRVAGLWINGWPSRLFVAEKNKYTKNIIERRNKLRAESWRLVDEIMDLYPHIRELSRSFGEYQDEMTEQQILWKVALSRPIINEQKIEKGLKESLNQLNLNWNLRRFDSIRDARTAWNAWDTRTAGNAWDTRAVWTARSAWNTIAARTAMDTCTVRATRDTRAALNAWAARDTWSVWAARDARAALIIYYAGLMKWIDYPKDLLTIGRRDAYFNGLHIATSTGPNELGWVMCKSTKENVVA